MGRRTDRRLSDPAAWDDLLQRAVKLLYPMTFSPNSVELEAVTRRMWRSKMAASDTQDHASTRAASVLPKVSDARCAFVFCSQQCFRRFGRIALHRLLRIAPAQTKKHIHVVRLLS